MKQIFNYAKKVMRSHYLVLLSVATLLFFMEILALVTPWLFGNLIDSLNIQANNNWSYYIFIIAIAMSINSGVSYLKAWIDIKKYIFKIDKDFELLAIKNILRFPVGQLKSDNTGEIQSVIQKGISSFSEYIKIILFSILPTLVFAAVTLVWLFFLSLEIFFIALAFVSITIFYMYWTNARVKNRFVQTRAKWQKIDSHRMEVIRNASLIIHYDQKEEILEDYKERYSRVEKMGISDWIHYVTRTHLINIIRIISMVGILMYGSVGVINGIYTAGEFVIIYSWVSSVFSKAGLLRQSFRMIMRLSPAIIKYLEMVERPLLLHEDGDIENISYGKVSFSNISYSYKEKKGVKSLNSKHALKNISFELEAGESLGVVGPSGAGKSTLVSLLMRDFNPSSGGIYLDNIPLNRYASSYKRNLGYIEQKPKLFDQSVRFNILFGASDKEGISDNDIYNVLNLVGLKEKISNLPKGLDSQIGEQGVKFSGGESQRLSIAGVLLKNPKLLILDEATSALDEISQRKIKQAIESMEISTTKIIIAHRLSTIRDCDKILVLNKGEIEYFGNYQEAQTSSLVFRKMLEESQLKESS